MSLKRPVHRSKILMSVPPLGDRAESMPLCPHRKRDSPSSREGRHTVHTRRLSNIYQLAITCSIGICAMFTLVVTSSAARQQPTTVATAAPSAQSIAAEFGLTVRERLGLQQIINELIYYDRARGAIRRRMHEDQRSLERRLTAFRRSKSDLVSSGRQSILHENQLEEQLFKMRESFATYNVFDQQAADKGVHVPGWGWVLLKAIPTMKQEMQRRNTERLRAWETGEATFPFTWPGFGRVTAKTLDAAIERDEEEIERMGKNPTIDDYSVPFPYLGPVTRKRLNASLEEARARLLAHRDELRSGRLVLTASDRPGQINLIGATAAFATDFRGWVTKAQLQERVATLESQKAAVWEQVRSKSLRIYTRHTGGWITLAELEASIADISRRRNELGRTIEQGDYQTYVPGNSRTFSRNSATAEIGTLQAQIDRIPAEAEYLFPVWGFGMMTLERIQQASKHTYLTAEHRANLRRAPSVLRAGRNLEINCLRVRQQHVQYIREQLVDHGAWEGDRFVSIRGTANPLISHYAWDLAERRALEPEFVAERHHMLYLLDLRINHLNQCLAFDWTS